MTEVRHEEIILAADDRHAIHLQVWSPRGDPVGAIQLLHGLGEHTMRYERFAKSAVARGYVVCGHDHRGHGLSEGERGYFADNNGWHRIVEDVRVVNDHIRNACGSKPVVLLAHSMGSFIGQTFAMHYGERLNGLLLSGSSWPQRLQLLPGRLIAKLESWRLGKRGHSALIDALGFGAFNRRFRPNRTDMDWLTRDEAEVDKYLADPLCGGPFTCGLWLDFLGVRLDSKKAAGKAFKINLATPDIGEKFVVELSNGTLTNIEGYQADDADLTVTIDREDLVMTMMGAVSFDEQIAAGKAQLEGNRQVYEDLKTMLVHFDLGFEMMPGTGSEDLTPEQKPFEQEAPARTDGG